jgi:tetratricopeptide (TPR) repeat protein
MHLATGSARMLLPFTMRHVTTWIAVGMTALAAPSQILAADDLQALLAASDAAYAARHEPGKLDEAEARLKDAEKLSAEDYEVLWRLARVGFWRSDDPKLTPEEQSRIGKLAWEVADRAVARAPARVEGHYFATVAMGNYSLGIGVIKALTMGIEGKFKRELSAAEGIDRKYAEGGIYNTWGRFYFSLPWPKYDAKLSEQNLREALAMNPANLRARVFLADLLLEEGNPKEAKRLLDETLDAKPGVYDLAEELRAQEMARLRLPKVEKKLK